MIPGGIDTGGGGISSSSSSGADGGTASSKNVFGDVVSSYSFGSGSATATSNPATKWYIIAGLAVAALIAIKMLKK